MKTCNYNVANITRIVCIHLLCISENQLWSKSIPSYENKLTNKKWWIEFAAISAIMAVLLAHFLYWHIKYQRAHNFGPESTEVISTNLNSNYDDARLSRMSPTVGVTSPRMSNRRFIIRRSRVHGRPVELPRSASRSSDWEVITAFDVIQCQIDTAWHVFSTIKFSMNFPWNLSTMD